MKKRLSKDAYYLGVARAVSVRGTCIRRGYGTAIINYDEVVSTGYVGSPRGALNCVDIGYCPRQEAGIPPGERYDDCRSVHSEQNALISVARKDIIGGLLYLFGENIEEPDDIHFKVLPCRFCKKMIINASISLVITGNPAMDIKRFDPKDWLKDGSFDIKL